MIVKIDQKAAMLMIIIKTLVRTAQKDDATHVITSAS